MFLAWCAMDEGHMMTGVSRGNGIYSRSTSPIVALGYPSDGRAVRVVQQPRGKWHFIDSVLTSCFEHSFTDVACASESPL